MILRKIKELNDLKNCVLGREQRPEVVFGFSAGSKALYLPLGGSTYTVKM
jgi:hypothetical protein